MKRIKYTGPDIRPSAGGIAVKNGQTGRLADEGQAQVEDYTIVLLDCYPHLHIYLPTTDLEIAD